MGILRTASRAAPPPESLADGNRLDDWQVGKLLAESSLARIFLARPVDAATQEYRYALKILKPRWSRHPHGLAMLANEVLAGRRVSHPNLVAILAAQLQEPPYFLVMPRYEGTTLASLVRHGEQLPRGTVWWVLRQVAEALDALHTAGRLHGDVKPHNMLLAHDGHATLLDLGFARPINSEGSVADRPLLGTLRYIAPEMITSSLRADGRSDLYSLGIVAYELLSGRAPFTGTTAAELAQQHRSARPAPLVHLVPNLRPEGAELVTRLIAKNPLHRIQSAREAVEWLVRLEIDELPAAA